MRTLSAILLLFLAVSSHAELKIVGETKVAPYRLVTLTAEGQDAKAGMVWRVYPKVGVDRAKTAKGLLQFVAPPGSYTVELQTIRLNPAGETETEETEVTVVIGTTPPTPPVPPVPPQPPVPIDDPLYRAAAAAYLLEIATDKATSLKGLASLYRVASDDAYLGKPAKWGELFDAMAAAARTVGVAGKIMGVQAALALELKSQLPTTRDAAITADGRKKASSLFIRIATILEAIK